MSNVSYPSRQITVADVPEVKEFDAHFIYNFFVPSERNLNKNEETGRLEADDIPNELRLRPGDTFDSARLDRISKLVPRFVKFSFVPPIAEDVSENEFVTRQNASGRNSQLSAISNIPLSVSFNIARSSIQDEATFSNNSFTGVTFQDDAIDQKLRSIVSGSVSKRISADNRLREQRIESEKKTIVSSLAGNTYSLTSAARALFEQTSGGTTDNLIVNALNTADELELSFVNEEQQEKIIDSAFQRVRNVSIKVQFNNKIIADVIREVVNDPMSQFSDDLTPQLPEVIPLQEGFRSNQNSNIISGDEYDDIFEAIDTVPVDAVDISSSTKIIGFIIEKQEFSPGDRIPRQREPIIVDKNDINTYVDLDVRYGSTYIYTIRTVALITIRSTIEEINTPVYASGLVASKKSNRVTVLCEETVPPPPPNDFNVMWDYGTDAPRLMWNFPTNPQRDIKYFQVFRRASVKEPFQLIREYDFDDSQVRTAPRETPDLKLVERLSNPLTGYTDLEFSKDSTFIYAVCCIDAHSFSSTYSTQIEVKFNRFKNQIEKRLISIAGAMKAYPNIFLNEDLFQDTIRDSNHSRMKIYFDPEFLRINDREGNDLELIAVSEGTSLVNPLLETQGSYRLQLINVDIQKQQVLNINIRDRRRTPASISSSTSSRRSQEAVQLSSRFVGRGFTRI